MIRRDFLKCGVAGLAAHAPEQRPNIIQILADDLGYADLGCYGGEIRTPNLDALASEGIRFTQAYVAAPICSPSRVGITTGQCPARHLIHSYLDTKKRHRELGMRDFLDPSAPCIARTFQNAGYATAHFGKWHMGGGRDVGEAPLPQAYGFDESLTSFEGLGDRVLPPGRLSEMNERLGRGKISHAPQHELTEIYVNRSIDFIRRSTQAKKPFYLHLWTNDVHDPFEPKPELMEKHRRFSANKYVQQYYAMLDEMDRQIGRLIAKVDELGIASNTLILFLSDNGPTAWPRYYKEGFQPPGRTAGLRGRKWSLYEGGIRVPLIARWSGRIPAARVDRKAVVSSLDLFPTCCRLAGISTPPSRFDGEDVSRAFVGEPAKARGDLYWEYGRDATYIRPGLERDQSPNLAIRSGRWKLLQNENGGDIELYDLEMSPIENESVASKHPAVARQLSEKLMTWRGSLPSPRV